jgi:tRNA pseudouridine38-40 synthase
MSESQALVGTHDFTSFCNVGADVKTKVRRISMISIENHSPLINIWVVGDGFLKQMVRIIVGSLVDKAFEQKTQKTVPSVAAMLQARQREAAGSTAPARGLSLVRVLYGALPETFKETRIMLGNHAFTFDV